MIYVTKRVAIDITDEPNYVEAAPTKHQKVDDNRPALSLEKTRIGLIRYNRSIALMRTGSNAAIQFLFSSTS